MTADGLRIAFRWRYEEINFVAHICFLRGSFQFQVVFSLFSLSSILILRSFLNQTRWGAHECALETIDLFYFSCLHLTTLNLLFKE